MLQPNILITNYCNQNCSFCFAKKEMNNKHIEKEIKLDDFIKILRKIKKNKVPTINLLGGEPTLHSQFEDIIKTSFQYAPLVKIFTNGLISQKKIDFLRNYCPNIMFIFNIMTPAFLTQIKMRKLITKNILELAPYAQIVLSMTIDPYSDVKTIQHLITQSVLRSISMLKISVTNPIYPVNNSYNFSDFPKLGQKVYEIVKYTNKSNFKINIALGCGFTRCMFTDKQLSYLIRKNIRPNWSCFGKIGSFDIGTNLDAFHCFPLVKKNRLPILSSSISKASAIFLLERYNYWSLHSKRICHNCQFYGLADNKCPGPCIAFALNENK